MYIYGNYHLSSLQLLRQHRRNMEIGKKIKAIRLLMGIGQLELAKNLGMKAATHVNRWEQGTATPRTNMLQRLGDSLEIYWPWLQDSNTDFVRGGCVHFRPLSPYVVYTPRWLALLQRDMPELLSELFKELNLQSLWGFQAPCRGGFIVAAKPGLTLLITCLPELFDAVLEALPSVKQVSISDSYFAEQLFLGTLTQDIFKRCGVEHVVLGGKPAQLPATKVRFEVKATAEADMNHQELRNTLQKHIDEIITAAGLSETDVTISVTAPRNSAEMILELVSNPILKELAQQLNDPKWGVK